MPPPRGAELSDANVLDARAALIAARRAIAHAPDQLRAIEAGLLLVRPRAACRMLGGGNTCGYELLAAGELDSFLDDCPREITVAASIRGNVARKLTAADATGAAVQRSHSEMAAGR